MLNETEYAKLQLIKKQNSFGADSETNQIFEVQEYIKMDHENFTLDFNITKFELHKSFLFGDLYPIVVVDQDNDVQLFDSNTTLTLHLPYHTPPVNVTYENQINETQEVVEPQDPVNVNETDILGEEAIEEQKKKEEEEAKLYIIDPFMYKYPPSVDGQFDLQSNMTFYAENGEFKLPKIYLQGTPGSEVNVTITIDYARVPYYAEKEDGSGQELIIKPLSIVKNLTIQLKSCEPGEIITSDGVCQLCEGPDFYIIEPVALSAIIQECQPCQKDVFTCYGGDKIIANAGY